MIKGLIFDFNRTIYDPERDDLIPGAKRVLQELKKEGYKMSLICKPSKNGQSSRGVKVLNLGLENYFSRIVVTEKRKKKEYHFKRCASSMSLTSLEIAIVGDRVEEEIYVGNKACFVTVWFKNGKFSKNLPGNNLQTPDFTIEKLEDLLKILREDKE